MRILWEKRSHVIDIKLRMSVKHYFSFLRNRLLRSLGAEKICLAALQGASDVNNYLRIRHNQYFTSIETPPCSFHKLRDQQKKRWKIRRKNVKNIFIISYNLTSSTLPTVPSVFHHVVVASPTSDVRPSIFHSEKRERREMKWNIIYEMETIFPSNFLSRALSPSRRRMMHSM